MLVGPSGAGKSHLATIWARQASARAVDAAALTRDTRSSRSPRRRRC